MAFGPLSLKPWEFWRLTHAEFLDMLEGYKLKSEWEMERLAWHAANVMNVHLKRKVTIKQLLGKDKKQQSMEDKRKQFEKLQSLLKKVKEGQ